MAPKKTASAASQLKRKGSSERAASAVDSDGEKVVDQGEKKKARLADGLEKPEQTDEVKKGVPKPTRQNHRAEEQMGQTGQANYQWREREAEGAVIDFRDPKRAAKRAQRIEKQPEGFTPKAFPKSEEMEMRRMSRLAREGVEAKDSSASGAGPAKETKAAPSSKTAKKWKMGRQ